MYHRILPDPATRANELEREAAIWRRVAKWAMDPEHSCQADAHANTCVWQARLWRAQAECRP